MTDAASSYSVVDAQPLFEIDAQSRTDMDARVQRLEVVHSEDGLSTFEAWFVHFGERPGALPGYLFVDDDAVPLGSELRVAVGADDNREVVFEGLVSSIGAHFASAQPALLKVCADDAGMRLRMHQGARSWEEEPADVIVTDAGRAARVEAQGLGDEVEDGYLQFNRPALATLRERARVVDARIVGALHGVRLEPARRGTEDVVVTLADELLSFDVSADLAHQRVEVRVHGWSTDEKAGVHGSAGADAVSAESSGGSTGPEILARLDFDAVEHVHCEAPTDAAQAQRFADILQRRRSRRFVVGRGVTRGTPGLRVGHVVDVRGVDTQFAGRYHVTTVRHVFDRKSGLRTHFDAERVDFGGGVAR